MKVNKMKLEPTQIGWPPLMPELPHGKVLVCGIKYDGKIDSTGMTPSHEELTVVRSDQEMEYMWWSCVFGEGTGPYWYTADSSIGLMESVRYASSVT